MTPALTSPEIFERRKRKSSPKQISHNQSIALKGSEKAIEVWKAKAKARKLSQVKINEKTNQILMTFAETLAQHAVLAALGCNYIYRLDPITKQNVLVEDPHEIKHALDLIAQKTPLDPASGGYYIMTTDKPDVNAIDKIWSRMFGKPSESLKVSGDIKVFSLTALAREREKLPAHVVEVKEISAGHE